MVTTFILCSELEVAEFVLSNERKVVILYNFLLPEHTTNEKPCLHFLVSSIENLKGSVVQFIAVRDPGHTRSQQHILLRHTMNSCKDVWEK